MRGGGGPYRGRLEVLAAGGVVEAYLDAWAAQRSVERLGPWRRVHGKLRPQRSPWAVLVYEGVGGPTVQVRLLEDNDARAGGPGGALRVGNLGPVEIVSCAADSALPGLPAVLAALDNPRVVRYHPGSRCTVHGGAGSAARYVKVRADVMDDQQEGGDVPLSGGFLDTVRVSGSDHAVMSSGLATSSVSSLYLAVRSAMERSER
jgi:hypothetical protein